MFYAVLKRTLDVVISLLLIVMLAPVWAGAALAVKLASPGRLLFRQGRGARGARPFISLKFRTLRADHRHDPGEIVPLTHHAVTPVGRILRRLKIDELPQLLNVLRGEMSLVGPRPTIMEQVLAYRSFQRRRLEVRPGITGLAQVRGYRGEARTDEALRLRVLADIEYIENWSISLDIRILLQTIPHALFARGAY